MNSAFNANNFEHSLELFLKRTTPHNRESYSYSTLPAGKLFRPQIIYALAQDLKIQDQSQIEKLAIAVELHHAYSLVHDDLPCMDDDDYRRGKESCHKKYNEWIAVLTGDGLLNLSYKSLLDIKHENLNQILKLFSWACGPRGLIEGQFQDLEGQKSIQDILRVHELKTGRLFQVCCLGAAYLSQLKLSNRQVVDFLKLGSSLGILFQLIDDLGELTQESISRNELEINPFVKDKSWALDKLCYYINSHSKVIERYQLKNFKTLVDEYSKKSFEKIKRSSKLLLDSYSINVEEELLPALLKLNS